MEENQAIDNANNVTPQSSPMKPDNHMAIAILTTIFCCIPTGIVAIVQASRVNNLYFTKQYELAQATSESAKKWSMISLGIGVAIYVIYIILMIAGVASLSALAVF